MIAATQADFYLPILKAVLVYSSAIVGITLLMGIVYIAAVLFPYAKDR